MPAGRKRDRIEIQQPTGGTAGSDGWKDHTADATWLKVAERKGEWIASGGREFVSGEKVQANIDVMVIFHFDTTTSTITPKMRLEKKSTGEVVQVEASYARGNKRREWVCQCKGLQ